MKTSKLTLLLFALLFCAGNGVAPGAQTQASCTPEGGSGLGPWRSTSFSWRSFAIVRGAAPRIALQANGVDDETRRRAIGRPAKL